MFNSPKSYENILQRGCRAMFAECLDKVCLGKLMIPTIKIAPECATFDTERGGTQPGVYCSMRAILARWNVDVEVY